MNNIFLTVEQSQMLISRGVNMYDAVMCYVSSGKDSGINCEERYGEDGNINCTYIKTKEIVPFNDIRKELYLNGETYRKNDIVPTYSLQEMLEKLPKWMIIGALQYRLVLQPNIDYEFDCGYIEEATEFEERLDRFYFSGANPIDCVFELYLKLLNDKMI